MQEAFGGIRDIIISRTQDLYLKRFSKLEYSLRRATASTYTLSGAPRFMIEASAMSIIVLISYFESTSSNGVIGVVPLAGTLALGLQRLLPVVQQVYIAWASLRGSMASLEQALHYIGLPIPDHLGRHPGVRLNFEKRIHLRNISFSYPNLRNNYVLNDVNLEIPKGARIGIVGPTGGGKSTFLDIFMGLLDPSKGTIEIDGVPLVALNRSSWQSLIAHVPQHIYLSDSSIAHNIAFGKSEDKIDFDRVRQVADICKLSAWVESLERGYDTVTGERGARVSGGQRQRIGIARAIYNQLPILILDEATSALDEHTEGLIMDAIMNYLPSVTILMVTHRPALLRYCSSQLRIENNQVSVAAGGLVAPGRL
jgi:ATP-binding cassette subfamily B protein